MKAEVHDGGVVRIESHTPTEATALTTLPTQGPFLARYAGRRTNAAGRLTEAHLEFRPQCDVSDATSETDNPPPETEWKTGSKRVREYYDWQCNKCGAVFRREPGPPPATVECSKCGAWFCGGEAESTVGELKTEVRWKTEELDAARIARDRAGEVMAGLRRQIDAGTKTLGGVIAARDLIVEQCDALKDQVAELQGEVAAADLCSKGQVAVRKEAEKERDQAVEKLAIAKKIDGSLRARCESLQEAHRIETVRRRVAELTEEHEEVTLRQQAAEKGNAVAATVWDWLHEQKAVKLCDLENLMRGGEEAPA